MGIFSWIILGGLSGWIVSLIVKTNSDQGIFGNIAVGITGALIGGFLGSMIFDKEVTGFNLSSILLAVLGGLIFVGVLHLLTGKKSI